MLGVEAGEPGSEMEKHPDEVEDPAEKNSGGSQSQFNSFDFFGIILCF